LRQRIRKRLLLQELLHIWLTIIPIWFGRHRWIRQRIITDLFIRSLQERILGDLEIHWWLLCSTTRCRYTARRYLYCDFEWPRWYLYWCLGLFTELWRGQIAIRLAGCIICLFGLRKLLDFFRILVFWTTAASWVIERPWNCRSVSGCSGGIGSPLTSWVICTCCRGCSRYARWLRGG